MGSCRMRRAGVRNQEHEAAVDGDGDAPEDAGQTHERQQTENQAQEEGPQRGLDVQIQVGRESVTGQQVRICRALRLQTPA